MSLVAPVSTHDLIEALPRMDIPRCGPVRQACGLDLR